MDEAFQRHRGRLFGLAYRMLGSAADAEDAVQDAYLRWQGADESRIEDAAAWLVKVVTNLCLNRLTSARARRERYVGLWLPEPVITGDGALGPLDTYERRESVSFGLLTLMERLTPAERAVFVLREAFGYRYAEIASLLDNTEAASRQLHRRAVRHLAERGRFDADPERARRLFTAFLAAAERGDVATLERVLAADVAYRADGGGKAPAARIPVVGRERVSRLLRGGLRKVAAAFELAPAEVNGMPAMLGFADGRLAGVMVAQVAEGRLAGLWLCANPDKLAFLAAQRGTLSHPGWLSGPRLHEQHVDPGDRGHGDAGPGGREEAAGRRS